MTFFWEIVPNPEIKRYSNNQPFLDNVKVSTIKSILKYKSHPSIVAIRNQCKNKASSSLLKLTKKKLNIWFLNQNVNKVSQSPDVPLKIVKENIDIFNDFLCTTFNISINSRKSPKNLKLAHIIPLHKKCKKDTKGNYRPVSDLPNLSKIFERCILHRCPNFLTIYFRNINMVSERTLVHNSVF